MDLQPPALLSNGMVTHRLVDGGYHPACAGCTEAILPGEFYVEVRRRDPGDVDADQRLAVHLDHFRSTDSSNAYPVAID